MLQKAPCAISLPSDDPNFTTTRHEQEERLNFIAQYTDAVMKAKLLSDKAATPLCAVLQKAPCAINLPADDPNFTTTRHEQEERLNFIARYTDAVIRAKLLGDKASADFVLHEAPKSALVQATDAKPGCFSNVEEHGVQGQVAQQ